MIEITGLPQPKGSYNIANVGSKDVSHILSTGSAKALLPADKVISKENIIQVHQEQQFAEQQQRIDIFVVRDNVFSLYKLPNGELFSKIRNLKTGEEKIFPAIDSLSYFEAMRGNRGMFVEQNV